MKRVPFGRMNWDVSPMGLGTFFLRLESRARGERIEAIRRALELGINYLDTAPVYGLGEVERIVGEAIAGSEKPFYLATKIGRSAEDEHDYTFDGCMRSFEASLKRLNVDRVDMVLIHDPDRCAGGSIENVTGPGMSLDAAQALKDQGLANAVGVGAMFTDFLCKCIRTGQMDTILSFHRYDALWSDAADLLAEAARYNVPVIAGAPFHQGLLARRQEGAMANKDGRIEPHAVEALLRYYDLADGLSMPVAELSLRFLLDDPGMSLVLVGAECVRDVELNVEALGRGELPGDVREKVDANRVIHSDPRALV